MDSIDYSFPPSSEATFSTEPVASRSELPRTFAVPVRSRPQFSSSDVASVICFIGKVASNPSPAIPTTHSQMIDILLAKASLTCARRTGSGSEGIRGMIA